VAKATQALFSDIDVVPLAKRFDGSVVFGGIIALKISNILANTVKLDRSAENRCNIVAYGGF